VTRQSASGRPQLDPAVVRRFQRVRICRAMAEEVRRGSYHATTVGDVVSTAGIARNTFYENFPNKEAVFIAVLEEGFAELTALTRSACEATDAGPGARRAALRAILGWVAEHPALAHCCLLAAPEGGEQAIARKIAAEDEMVDLLCGPTENRRTRTGLGEFLCGGVSVVLARMLVADAAVEAPQRLDDLAGVLDLADTRAGGAP